MKLINFFLISTIVLIVMTGCQDSSMPPIAVVDLDKVATTTGQTKVLEEQILVFAEDTKSKLNQIKDELNNQLGQAKENLGQQPTKKDQAEFQQTSAAAQLKLRQELAQGERLLQQKRAQLIQAYRQSIEPTIRRIAQQKKIKVVMIKQQNFLYIDSSSDITDAVIDAIQAMSASVESSNSN